MPLIPSLSPFFNVERATTLCERSKRCGVGEGRPLVQSLSQGSPRERHSFRLPVQPHHISTHLLSAVEFVSFL
jgi:hypothetical protein